METTPVPPGPKSPGISGRPRPEHPLGVGGGITLALCWSPPQPWLETKTLPMGPPGGPRTCYMPTSGLGPCTSYMLPGQMRTCGSRQAPQVPRMSRRCVCLGFAPVEESSTSRVGWEPRVSAALTEGQVLESKATALNSASCLALQTWKTCLSWSCVPRVPRPSLTTTSLSCTPPAMMPSVPGSSTCVVSPGHHPPGPFHCGQLCTGSRRGLGGAQEEYSEMGVLSPIRWVPQLS